MIRTVKIQNFKSIEDMQLELGRVTVLIGENGCGKTNVLEAVGIGAAAAANKLDNEFLISRGIRVTDPILMRAGFTETRLGQPLILEFIGDGGADWRAVLQNDNKPYSKWSNIQGQPTDIALGQLARGKKVNDELLSSIETEATAPALLRWMLSKERAGTVPEFLAYSPQINTLRELERESHIEPLGIYGEGLFRLLKTLQAADRLSEVRENLRIIDWFDSIEPVDGSKPSMPGVRIRDQFMDENLPSLDQNSANEGFLFLLFYTCLFMSTDTPRFFAIDNVESALNPKVCTRLVRTMIELARKYDKQVILTTHNPAVLDGLDLSDDEQRLMVVYRNIEGRTRVRRVAKADVPEGETPVRLSEAFLRGYIGGLPTNF